MKRSRGGFERECSIHRAFNLSRINVSSAYCRIARGACNNRVMDDPVRLDQSLEHISY